ncbi:MULTISPECIES: hydantoin utilization protein A [Prochlorococcus]|uniref:hydantoin utilization protein A n=1 Tax=Prochlorococcus TaxID=1218 RepID=UPI0005339712|nr:MULTISPECIES: hydantoin utilization protein A [Prochlorococcus]KGG33446.1 Nickel transporter UreH [Prochlorococcus marinus str. SS51]
MLISILTGFAAGAVHVVGGADHLIAMAPSAFRKPKLALRNGLAWGLGHSTGVLILSAVAILVKDFAQIERMSSFAELSVGVFLLVVGFLTIRTSLGLNIHTHDHHHGSGNKHKHFHLHFRGSRKHSRHSHASTSLGLLHGLAGASHLLAVIPALALPPFGASLYLFFYLLGSIVAMGAVVSAMSLAILRAGKNNLPIIFRFTGLLSILTGFFWIHKTSSYIF